ncbi:MAG TPA: amino acid permease C-terminal domain-containing protein, partial [Methanobacterium sp.]|nr:amino acid permease C-terminal domain-containing protein [Methanobacterium sp.]
SAIIELVNIGTLSAFIFLALSIIILRKQHPEIPRKFKCPLVPIIPLLSIIASLGLITQLKLFTIEAFAVSLIIGLAVYFAYGARNSKLRNNENNVDNESFYNEIKGYKFLKQNFE